MLAFGAESSLPEVEGAVVVWVTNQTDSSVVLCAGFCSQDRRLSPPPRVMVGILRTPKAGQMGGCAGSDQGLSPIDGP